MLARSPTCPSRFRMLRRLLAQASRASGDVQDGARLYKGYRISSADLHSVTDSSTVSSNRAVESQLSCITAFDCATRG